MQQQLIPMQEIDIGRASGLHEDLVVAQALDARHRLDSAAEAVRDTERDERLMMMLRDLMNAEDWAEHHFLPSLYGHQGRVDITILSHGAGTQTSALSLLAACNGLSSASPGDPGYIEIDMAMLSNVSDHGRPNEWPETIEYLWNLNRLTYLPITKVDPYVWNQTLAKQNDDRGLFDRYYQRETMPFRSFRGCTDMFKIIPQESFMAWLIAEAAKVGVDLRIRQVIGYSVDEEDRAAKFHASHPNVTPYFPLIEWGWRRNDTARKLKEIAPQAVSAIGLPEKSGCWFCPFQAVGSYDANGDARPRSWLALRDEHRDLLAAAQAMEARQNARRITEGKRPAFLAGDRPLQSLLVSLPETSVQQGNLGLDGFEGMPGDDTCTSWGCFR
jgi:hypothetical protein